MLQDLFKSSVQYYSGKRGGDPGRLCINTSQWYSSWGSPYIIVNMNCTQAWEYNFDSFSINPSYIYSLTTLRFLLLIC